MMTRGLLLGCVAAAVISVVSSFTDITDAVFGSAKASVLSAFGDFNSDKLTDLFIVSSDFHNLEVWIATGAKPSFEKSDVKCSVPGTITSVMPGDFDGDSIMDVLVTSTTDAAGKGDLNVHVFWGRLRMGVDCATNGTSLVVTHQPLLFDFNSDRVVDILSALSSTPSVRTVWSFGRNKTVSTSSLGVGVGPLAKPHSNSYVDLNDDMTADLMLTAEASMELWFWVGNGTFSGPHRRDYPEGASVRGQSLFVDIDADGDMEHLMPVCVGNADCSSSAIMVFNGSVWIKWFDDFRDVSNQTWHFRRSNEHPGIDVPITLRTADVDMDGYPDILAVLEGKPKGQKKTVSRATLLLNIACPSCPYGRRLVPFWNYGGLADFDAVRLAAFFDIDEDGQMDVLLVNGTRTATGLRTHALRNQFSDDACFIKVLAVSGLCYSDCPSGQIAYGTNQPGPFVRYRIIKSDGYPQASGISLLPRHFEGVGFGGWRCATGLDVLPPFASHVSKEKEPCCVSKMEGTATMQLLWQQIYGCGSNRSRKDLKGGSGVGKKLFRNTYNMFFIIATQEEVGSYRYSSFFDVSINLLNVPARA